MTALRTTRHVLDNGLTVILREAHAIPITSSWLWYHVGSRNEPSGMTGAAHWVEHMMFKGTPTFPKGQLDKLVARNGGTFNAFTNTDYTAYFETLPATKLDLALRLESDRMANALFEPQEAEAERTVIISEREGLENYPEFLLAEEVSAAAFKVHPYHHEVIGWKSDLQAMRREQLYSLYRTHYAPNNATLVLVGDFDSAETLARIQELFGAIPRVDAIPVTDVEEPPQRGERRVRVRQMGPTSYVQIVYHAPAATHEDAAALMVLDAVLSGAKPMSLMRPTASSRSARLYRALVETELASDASSGFSLTVDPGLFSLDATVRPERAAAVVEEALLREVEKVIGDGVSDEELAKARKQTRAQLAYSTESAANQAYWLGFFDLLGDYERFERFEEGIASVSREQVQAVAQKYLLEDNRTVGHFTPVNPPNGGGAMPTAPLSRSWPHAVFYRSPTELPMIQTGSPLRMETCGRGVRTPTCAVRHLGVPHSSFSVSTGQSPAAVGPETVRREVLGNGAVVLAYRNSAAPSLVVMGNLKAGAVLDPADRRGLASLTGDMLERGTARRSFQQLNEELDSVGASLYVGAGGHTAGFVGKALVEDTDLLLDVMGDVMRNPTFPEEEVRKLRGETLSDLRELDDDTRHIASQRFRELLYPAGHPYHYRTAGYVESVGSISRSDLEGFYRRYYDPRNLTLIAVGDMDAAAMVDKIGRHLGDWRPGAEVVNWRLPPTERPHQGQSQAVAMPDKTQVDLAWGFLGMERLSPDYYPAFLLDVIWGQLGMMGRLGEKVREELGLAYYVYSRLEAGFGPGPWSVRAGINPRNVQRALDAVTSEARRLLTEPVTEEELADVNAFLTGSMPLRLETNEGLATALISMEEYGLGLDYIQRYPQIIGAVTREEMLAVARQYIEPDKAVYALAGPECRNP